MKNCNWWKTRTEAIIFNVKWLLIAFYLGLVAILFLYGFAYVKEIIHLTVTSLQMSTDELKIVVLDTVDVVMIANLVKMIIAGSYNSFISKDHGYLNESISSGMLKIKIGTSILVVSAIHLLKEFVNKSTDWDNLHKQLLIYVAFLATALVLGILEYLHVKSEVMEHDTKQETPHH